MADKLETTTTTSSSVPLDADQLSNLETDLTELGTLIGMVRDGLTQEQAQAILERMTLIAEVYS